MISAKQSTAGHDATHRPLAVAALQGLVVNGGLRNLNFAGAEVLRGLTYPVRDANWGTIATQTVAERLDQTPDTVAYHHEFRARDGGFTGLFDLHVAAKSNHVTITASMEISVTRPLLVNRAGFNLLHPLDQVAGTPMKLRHPDGSESRAAFPRTISPGQTARNIAGLAQQIGTVTVDITFAGDVFEMEDQRNWSDASFKTYCRPLALPRPFALKPGSPLQQTIVLQLGSQTTSASPRRQSEPMAVRMPQVAMAHQPGLSDARQLSAFPTLPVLARLTTDTHDTEIATLVNRPDLTLELVAEDAGQLSALAQRCLKAGLRPTHCVALPSAYLISHQPEGPWPTGDTPADFAKIMRKMFPKTAIGAGSLTNFTELNRCPPVTTNFDFVTFGNTAIVHAADDMSVFQTLEALPYIFASARVLAADRPLRLGLMSIGMRSNPYGADVVENPGGALVPMARIDPRQNTGFAAAYGVGILAAAARGGVESLALAMPDGPLGVAGPTPLGRVIIAAAQMVGQSVEVAQGAGWVCLTGKTGGMAANFTNAPLNVPGAGSVAPQAALVFGGVAA